MKTSTLLLVASLVANGALVTALVMRRSSSAPATNSPAKAAVAPATATTPATGTPVSPNVPAVPLWTQLRSDDLAALKGRLHAAGFSSKEIRAMMAMAINEEITRRREALLGKPEDTPYWKNPGQIVRDPQLQAQQQEIYRDARRLSYQYVDGPDALAESDELLANAKRRFGNLPLDKLQQLTALEHDAEDLQMAASARFSGRRDRESMQAAGEIFQALQREKLAQVAKLLSPAELEQYELRNNAPGLSVQLAAFRPTEEEFKAIYALEKARRQVLPDAGLTPAQMQADHQAKITAALGPERAADYAALHSGAGDQLPRLLARLDLPLSTLTTINGVRDDINRRAKTVLDDRQLTAAQRSARLAALAQEADEMLGATLGARGYEAYKDLKGDWIRALKPKSGPGGP